jgi:hypothetical protein
MTQNGIGVVAEASLTPQRFQNNRCIELLTEFEPPIDDFVRATIENEDPIEAINRQAGRHEDQ